MPEPTETPPVTGSDGRTALDRARAGDEVTREAVTLLPESVTVLHVDDDPEIADIVKLVLEREEDRITVRSEPDGEAALAALEDERVDCVISDYQMPGMDGLELLEAVRAESPEIPFILFTGKGSEEIASQAISAGVTDYLQKGGGTDRYTMLVNRLLNAVARRRAEEQVERSFEALETAREGVSILDADGYFRYVNEAYATIVGYDRTTLLGEHWELLYPDGDVDHVHEEILPAIPADGRWSGETVYVRGDGDRILVDHAIARTADDGLVCLLTDLSNDDREAGTAGPLVAEDAFVEFVLDALEDVFYVIDAEGWIVRVNDRASEVSGYSKAELTSMHASEVFVEADQAAIVDAVEETMNAGVSEHEFSLRTKDGRRRPFEFRTRRLDNATADPIGLVGIGRDIADRKRRERRLRRQANAFESFASVLSHDLQGPINAVQMRLDLARSEDNAEQVDAAEAAVERLSSLVGDLSSVMREGSLTGELEPVEIGTLAQNSWSGLPTTDATLEVESEPAVQADPEALTRLLDNVLRNAIEHGGPDVCVRIGSLEDGFYVADDGAGVKPSDRESVFEPGVTSKDDGLGFGMASVRQIAMAHGWAVSIADSESGGARIEFTDVDIGRDGV